MHDASHVTMILDIAKDDWLIEFVSKLQNFWLQKLLKKSYGRYQDLIENYITGQSRKW